MPSREFLKEEVLACAQKLAALSDIDFVCIDIEDTYVGTGTDRVQEWQKNLQQPH